MGKKYSPRRAGKRWLDGAPPYVLDVLDNRGKTADRYTVLFGGEFVFHVADDGKMRTGGDQLRNTYVCYLGMSDYPTSPVGFSQWGELPAYDAAAHRYRSGRDRIRWQDLPERIQRHVIARASE